MVRKSWWCGVVVWALLGLHFFMHNPGGSGLYLPFNAWGWVFLSAALGLGAWQATHVGQLRVSRLGLQWLLLALLLCLPMVWSQSEIRDYAWPRLMGLAGGMLFLLSLYQWRHDVAQRRSLLWLVLGAVAIEMTLGLVQYYLLTPGNWLGYNTAINRPYGIFQQPNVMASLQATELALALWLWGEGSTLRWQQWLNAYVIAGSCLLLVVLQSRVGQLGGVMALLLVMPWLKSQRRLRLPLLLAGTGLLLGCISLYAGQGATRGLEIYQSGGMRSVYWPYALELLLQAPLTGWGYGSFESVFLHSYMADKAVNPAMVQIEYNLDHPHNELLYWAVEGGILPLLALLGMGLTLLWRVMGAACSGGWPKALALLALVTPIALHTQTEYPFYHSVTHWIIFLMLVWFIDEECESGSLPQIREIAYPHKLLLRFLAIGIPLIVVPFMLTALHTAWLVTKYERGGYKQPELLLKIVNPVAWLTRVEFDINAVRLSAALTRHDNHELQAYVDWGRAFVRHTPRANIYANMLLALNAMGEHEQADKLRCEALALYPDDPQLKPKLAPSSTVSAAHP